jgi:glycosyltransferase involved in cell wall biosynthesis
MTQPQPKVSIGMPLYNAEIYVEEALKSILAQTYTNFELIISDNASTDRTQSICSTYAEKDSRIIYHRNEKNLGIAPNFNKVFQLSKGEYFKWAAYDDILEPEFLMSCVKTLDANPDVVICYPRAKVIDEKGNYVIDYDPGPNTASFKPQERFQNLILYPEYAIQQMGLIRSAVMRQTVLMGSYPSSDEVFLAELSLLGRYYEIPERLFIYRRSNQQLANKLDQRSRVPFFDTALAGKIVLPKWLYFFACLNVIYQNKLDWTEKLSCYITMIRWFFVAPHIRALGKDLLLAIYQYCKRIRKIISRKSYDKTIMIWNMSSVILNILRSINANIHHR